MEMKMKKLLCVTGALTSLMFSGLAISAEPAANSGFLPDYSKLQPVQGKEGVKRHINKAIDLRPFTKLYLEPVQVVVSTEGAYKAVQPDVLKRMTDALQSAFNKALSPGYEVVAAPAADALRVRMAITGIQPASPALGASDFLPIVAIFNAGRAASGNAPKVAEMSAEIEVLDGRNQQVFAGVVTRKAEKTLPQGEKITWNDLAPIADAWAKQFRLGLDEARGVAAKR